MSKQGRRSNQPTSRVDLGQFVGVTFQRQEAGTEGILSAASRGGPAMGALGSNGRNGDGGAGPWGAFPSIPGAFGPVQAVARQFEAFVSVGLGIPGYLAWLTLLGRYLVWLTFGCGRGALWWLVGGCGRWVCVCVWVWVCGEWADLSRDVQGMHRPLQGCRPRGGRPPPCQTALAAQ